MNCRSQEHLSTATTHSSYGPSGKYVSASEKARKQDEVVISESKWEVPKVDSDEDSDFECCSKSNRKPFYMDVYKLPETFGNPTLALLPNISE